MMSLIVRPDGSVRMIYSDDLAPLAAALGEATTRRASDVEPCGSGWTADMARVGGPLLGPFDKRQAALDAEREWLEQQGLPAVLA